MPGHLPALRTLILAHCPPTAGSRQVFCFGINWAGCGKIGSRLPKLSVPASFTGLSTMVTELPPPCPAVPSPQLHLPPLVPD